MPVPAFPPFQRTALAVLVGVVTNLLVVSGAEWLAHRLLGGPGAADLDALQQQVAVAFLEPQQLLAALGGALVAAWAAGFAAARVAPGAWSAVVAVALLVVLTNGLNAFTLPHPLWFKVLAVALPEPLVWWGARRAVA